MMGIAAIFQFHSLHLGRGELCAQASTNYGRGTGEVHTVKLSMLELYNEQLRDLLAPNGAHCA